MKIRFNLLPLQQKKHLHTQKVLRMVMEQEIYIVIVCGFFVMSLFAMYFILNMEAVIIRDIEKRSIERLGYQEISGIHDKFRAMHKTMSAVEDLQKNHYQWSAILVLLSENVVDGVGIEEISTADNKLKLRATADTREQVVVMKEKLREVRHNEVQCFENVSVPESDLAAPVNITFTMTFDINLGCLQ